MTYQIKFEPGAEEDLENAFLWILERPPTHARPWRDRLEETLTTLEHNPQRCPLAPENEAFNEDVRQLLYGKRGGVYRILFAVRENTVHILHIRHAARKYLGESGGNQ